MENKKIVHVMVSGSAAAREQLVDAAAEIFEDRGYAVFIVEDSARQLAVSGADPETLGSARTFGRLCTELHSAQYRVYSQAARDAAADKVLVLYNGGGIEPVIFLGYGEWSEILQEEGLHPLDIYDRYDGVLFVETEPRGDEALEEDILTADSEVLAAWTGHPHLRVISRSLPGKQKARKMVEELNILLGDPQPYEIERKYLIEYPDLAWLGRLPHCRKVEISQTYLTLEDGEQIRIRKRGFDGHFTYFETKKQSITGLKRIEIEKNISEEEYERLLGMAGPCPLTISKARYCFLYKSQYFELDIYPFWTDKAVLEIELPDEEAQPDLPPQVHVIRDVTEDADYTNVALAASLCASSEA